MKKHSMPEMKEGGVNVTPLIDIVMCLIIFFMLVAKIGVTTGADASIKVPPAFVGKKIADMGNTITLNVSVGPTEGDPSMTATVGNITSNLTINGAKTLYSTLIYFTDGDKAKGIAPNPNFKVIIRGDKALPFSSLAPVLSECAHAKVKTVAIATSQGQKPGTPDEGGGQ